MSEMVQTVLFYAFALVSVLLAIAVVASPRILRAAVYLMGVLASSAGLFLLLGAEFLAGVQILVYVGGIVVLLVFAIMLTRSVELKEDEPSLGRKLMGFLGAAGFLGASVTALSLTDFPVLQQGVRSASDTMMLGKKLLDYGPQGYVLPFEVISLLLLAAVIGGIVVARKTSKENS